MCCRSFSKCHKLEQEYYIISSSVQYNAKFNGCIGTCEYMCVSLMHLCEVDIQTQFASCK